jgi:hypothetical protein
MKPTPEMIEKWWRESKIVGLAPVNLEWEQRAFTLAYADGYDAGYAAGAAQQRETDAADARRYRWLAADGDRAKRLLNERSGHEVQDEIDMAIRAQQEAKG